MLTLLAILVEKFLVIPLVLAARAQGLVAQAKPLWAIEALLGQESQQTQGRLVGFLPSLLYLASEFPLLLLTLLPLLLVRRYYCVFLRLLLLLGVGFLD